MHRPSDEQTPEEARQDHWQMLGFLAFNAGMGAGLGLFLAASIVWPDLGGVGSLLTRSSNPVLPALMMALPLALTFAAAATASAVMLMPYRKKKQRG